MPVLTAGQAVLGVVGTRRFKLRLTAAGKRLCKRVKRTRLAAEGTFTRFGERPSARKTTFVLRRKQLIGSALARCWTARADRLTRAGQQAAHGCRSQPEQAPDRALESLEGRREAPGCAALPTGLVSSRRHIEPCMRFSRTRLTDVLHRRHSVGPA